MPTDSDSGAVQARLQSVLARGRVADVLLGVALDVVEPFASDYLSADDYSRLCSVVQAAVDAAADAAVTTLETELALIPDGDLDIRRRQRRARFGRV